MDTDGTPQWFEQHVTRLDGKELVVEMNGAKFLYKNQTAIQIVARDVTDRKLAEEALQTSERLVRSIIESIPIGLHFYDLDSNGRLIFTGSNPAADHILNIDNASLIGKTITEAFPILDGTKIPDRYIQAARDGIKWETERVNYINGSVQNAFEQRLFQITPGRAAGSFMDITERKQGEEALRRVNRQLQMISDCNQVLIRITDETELLTAICKIIVGMGSYRMAWVGFAENDEIKSIRPVAHAGFEEGYLKKAKITWDDSEHGRGPIGTAVRTGKPSIIQNIGVNKLFDPWVVEATQRGFVSVCGLPLNYGDHILGVLGIYSTYENAFDEDEVVLLMELAGDLGIGINMVQTRVEQRRAEAQVLRMNEELEERVNERTKQLLFANKELEAFAYSVSHDLRAPLRTINGYTRILLEDYGNTLDDEGKRLTEVIVREAKRMGQLIEDLLAFSRLARTELNVFPVDMTALANIVFQELGASEKDHIQFKVQPLPRTTVDPSLIRQVWMNLLSNAIKFSRKRELAIIEVGCNEDVHQVTFWVRDNGAGFNMQYSDHLFGVFHRLHSEKEFEGTGVGLAIVQRIIHRHGGTVWAQSEVDHGATFFFSLPRKDIKRETD
jgi:signal transduction histidine kinase/PAS domain-containing protein